jgi:hypothetical protein
MFDGIAPRDRILPSRFDRQTISLTPAAPEAEAAWEQMEIRHTSFLLRNTLVLQSTLKCGNSVEHWEHIFLTRIFDIELAYAQFASNIQVIYHLEEIRKQLEQLSFEHSQLIKSDEMKNTLHKGLPDDRAAVSVAMALNPTMITWEEHRRKIVEIEAHLNFEFGVVWWERPVEGVVISRSYALIPLNEGSMKAKREAKEM